MQLTPLVILCSGQSNMARSDINVTWSAPDNLRVWNYDRIFGDESAGTSFISPNTQAANYAEMYGAAVARHEPERMVFVINISRGQTGLLQWLPSAEPINMLQAILANVPAALEQIRDKNSIDQLLWWGHESDAAELSGLAVGNFPQTMAKVLHLLDQQEWSNKARYPIHLHKIHCKCHTLANSINFGLTTLARDNPERIHLHDVTGFPYSDNIHLDGDQKYYVANHVYKGNYKIRTFYNRVQTSICL